MLQVTHYMFEMNNLFLELKAKSSNWERICQVCVKHLSGEVSHDILSLRIYIVICKEHYVIFVNVKFSKDLVIEIFN